jgi:hypothetical protein
MPQDHSRHTALSRATLTRTALGAALAALLVCANTPAARAGDDGDDGESITTKVMRTLGLKDPTAAGAGIDYSERSPLVVPPTRTLPPPVAAAPPPVPDWPKDPDIKRRAAVKEQKVGPHIDNVVESNRPLSPSELNIPGPDRNAPVASDGQGDPSAAKKSPFSFDWFKKEQYATFTGEPARANLTDPPPGYRTPSVDQPYGVGPQRPQQYDVPTVASRMEAPH